MNSGSRIFLASVFACLLLCFAILGLVVDSLMHIPDFSHLKDKVEVTIYLPDGSTTTRWFGPHTPEWVSISQISNALLSAVISSEDTTFYQHKGIDYHELREALKKDIEEKRWARGASTITQQMVKNVYLGREKTLWRKVKEFIWARELSKHLSKSEILCFYVNLVEWGPNIYGIKQAANHYFNESPSELTPKQSAFLAMLLPSPLKYHVYYEKRELTSWAANRVSQILNVMNSMGFIDDDAYQVAMNESLWGEVPAPAPTDMTSIPTEETALPSEPPPPTEASPDQTSKGEGADKPAESLPLDTN